jgi:hypothetical protein
VLAAAPTPKNHFPNHSRAAKSQIGKHELIHNFSKCFGLTTTCNPTAKAARISSTYPNRVGLTTFPFQTYKGSLGFPNFGLFFNLGVLGGWGGVGFWILCFIGLGAGLLKAIFSGFFSLGRLVLRGASAFRFLGPGTSKLCHKCRNGLPST